MKQQNYFEHAVSYALSTIRWLFVINTGALLVLLGITGMVASRDTALAATTVTFVTYISAYSIYFIGGLVLVICSSMFGYLSCAAREWNYESGYHRYQIFGLLCAVGSLAAFVAGIISCMYAFSDLASS